MKFKIPPPVRKSQVFVKYKTDKALSTLRSTIETKTVRNMYGTASRARHTEYRKAPRTCHGGEEDDPVPVPLRTGAHRDVPGIE